jgi:tRNA (cmo5U34)-methyltransferase
MSLSFHGVKPVHMPDGDSFQFDEEVAQIFPDMARRSIPLYEEAHRMHVSMFYDKLSEPGSVVYDVGSSRGNFFREICNQLQIYEDDAEQALRRGYSWVAIDTSEHMLKHLKRSMPSVTTIAADVLKIGVLPQKADVVVMMYLLQFIKETDKKLTALRWAYEQLKPGGVLILGQKEDMHPAIASRYQEEYFKFRRTNGYTQEEIDRKTAALKNSMWPISNSVLRSLCLEAGFAAYHETSRWLQFSTAICVKK